MDFKRSKTFANLLTAYAGESQTESKYTFYAEQAEKEGQPALAELFSRVAEQEKRHTKIWFTLLHGGETPGLQRLLEDAADGEHFEWSELYASFAETAKEEGCEQMARQFHYAAGIEREHEQLFRLWARRLSEGRLYADDQAQDWHCQSCGYRTAGTAAPHVCPFCKEAEGSFTRADPLAFR